MWDSTGRLVAQSRQLGLVLSPLTATGADGPPAAMDIVCWTRRCDAVTGNTLRGGTAWHVAQ